MLISFCPVPFLNLHNAVGATVTVENGQWSVTTTDGHSFNYRNFQSAVADIANLFNTSYSLHSDRYRSRRRHRRRNRRNRRNNQPSTNHESRNHTHEGHGNDVTHGQVSSSLIRMSMSSHLAVKLTIYLSSQPENGTADSSSSIQVQPPQHQS